MTLFLLIVAAVLLLIGDRVANAIAENDMANQFTADGFPVKPSVTIEGFPFLTQLAAHDLRKVYISAGSVPVGPVTVTSIKTTLTGVHFNSSFSGATIDSASATLHMSFGALAAAGGLGDGTGISITPAGTDKLKITAGVGGAFTQTEKAVVKQTGPRQVSVQVLNSGGVVGSLLSSFGTFSVTLPPGIPPSLRITRLTINDKGLTLSAAGTDVTFRK